MPQKCAFHRPQDEYFLLWTKNTSLQVDIYKGEQHCMWSHRGDPLGFQDYLGVGTNRDCSPKQNGHPRGWAGTWALHLSWKIHLDWLLPPLCTGFVPEQTFASLLICTMNRNAAFRIRTKNRCDSGPLSPQSINTSTGRLCKPLYLMRKENSFLPHRSSSTPEWAHSLPISHEIHPRTGILPSNPGVWHL